MDISEAIPTTISIQPEDRYDRKGMLMAVRANAH